MAIVRASSGLVPACGPGCLSIPGLYAPVVRAAHVVAAGTGQDGQPLRVEGTGELARCPQHEMDHLDGYLYLGRLSPPERRRALATINSRQRAQPEGERRARSAALSHAEQRGDRLDPPGSPRQAVTTRVGQPGPLGHRPLGEGAAVRLGPGQVPQFVQDTRPGLIADHQPVLLPVADRGGRRGETLPAAHPFGAVRGPQRAGDREVGSAIRVRHEPTMRPGGRGLSRQHPGVLAAPARRG